MRVAERWSCAMRESVLSLHRELVEIPSLSHEESGIADFVESRLRRSGADVERIENNIIAWRGEPKLLFNSHLDTVPASESWSRPPLQCQIEQGRIYGLGSNDAKGAVAAMIHAFESFEGDGLALLLAQEEETGGRGTETVWPILRDQRGWRPEAIVVGEPTDLQIGVSQDGMMVLEIVAEGDACHAAHAESLGARNPAYALARDLVRLEGLELPTRPQATMLSGSTARNQVGSDARAVIDLRTKPGMVHEELAASVQQALASRVEVKSIRLRPFGCDPDARVVSVIRAVSARSAPFHSHTMSDQVHYQGEAAVKFGPGRTERSHTPDEYIEERELIEGAETYLAIAGEFLR